MMRTFCLNVQSLHEAYGDRTVLDISELRLKSRTSYALVGPNGSGKSTFLKVLSGVIDQTSGFVDVEGDASREELLVGYMPQKSYVFGFTVFKNVALALQSSGLAAEEVERRVRDALDAVGMSAFASERGNGLSGGEAQRVNLARAMVLEPEALFLDEPFSALDFPTKVQLLKDMKEVVENTRTTVVFISHDMMEIKYFTNRLLILMDGEIKQMGPTEEVLSNPNQAASPFIGEWNRLIQ